MVKGRQGERVRLYVRGTILGYKRSKLNQYPNTSLVQIEGVNTKEEVAWYAGKRLAYIYKAKVKKNGTHYRCLWGKVTRPHGNNGIVRSKFTSNLPPKSMGSRIRVFMYPRFSTHHRFTLLHHLLIQSAAFLPPRPPNRTVTPPHFYIRTTGYSTTTNQTVSRQPTIAHLSTTAPHLTHQSDHQFIRTKPPLPDTARSTTPSSDHTLCHGFSRSLLIHTICVT
ncbi:unnamed protein product [Vicia faba]|uniref:Uncharacterized protein n=1 Tax=Vicia faba TaxID=3906 RepID=A0AAV0YZC6_VICFA|nr:unnamed protein product [Vicia faba]